MYIDDHILEGCTGEDMYTDLDLFSQVRVGLGARSQPEEVKVCVPAATSMCRQNLPMGRGKLQILDHTNWGRKDFHSLLHRPVFLGICVNVDNSLEEKRDVSDFLVAANL